MTQGAALPPPTGGGAGGGGVWGWARPITIGVIVAAVLLVVLATLLGDLRPGTGGDGVISGPVPSATPTASTPAPVDTTVPTTEPPSGGDGTDGDGSGTGTNPDTGGGGSDGSSKPGGGSNGGARPTRTGVPTPTGRPPTPPPHLPVGPDHCTVRYDPGYCFTRQRVAASVMSGPLTLAKALGTPVTGGTASVVKLMPSLTGSGPSVSGNIEPVSVVDARGVDEGWRLRAELAWPGGPPAGVLVTVDPWCIDAGGGSAPGISPGPIAQSLDGDPATVCTKDDQLGAVGSTGGRYLVGATVSLSTWVGTPIPATAVLVTLSVN